jgi:hypothetical protein
VLEPFETLRQDVGGYPRDVLQQLVEPPRSGEQRLDDEQGPPVPDTHESVGEWGGRALAYLGLLFAHRRTVSESIGHIPVK